MISIEVTKQTDVAEWEAALLGGIADGMPVVAEVLREDAVRCFDEERDPHGNAWAPNKPSTLRERARLGKTGKIGTRDEILKGSLAGSSTATTARVAPGGAAAAYAAQFQFGDEDQEGRAYLPILPGGEVQMPEHLKTEIVETLRDAIRLRIGQIR